MRQSRPIEPNHKSGIGAVATAWVQPAERESLAPLLDQSFEGIYLWHARRTLRSVPWVRVAARGQERIGLSMLSLLGGRSGYVYYLAVTPSQRNAGVGGVLLDDAILVLRAEGAVELLACIREDNIASVRLFTSRGFVRTAFRELARSRGLLRTASLWLRMVAAPGERVFLKIAGDETAPRPRQKGLVRGAAVARGAWVRGGCAR